MAGRPERALHEDGTPLTALATALRELRRSAGSPSYREMGQRVHRSPTTLSEAAGGERHPTWDTLSAYVTACGGDPAPWRERWEAAARREGRPAMVEAAEGAAAAPTTTAAVARPERRWLWPAVAAACLLVGLGVGFVLGAATGGGSSSPGSAVARDFAAAPGLGAVTPAPTQSVVELVVADGTDPQDTGCARLPGVETLDNTEVQQDGVPVGLAQLKYSPGCGASWPRFEPFPGAKISPDTVVHVDIVRPATGAQSFAFSAPYVTDQATFGNLALSTSDCVYASVSLETAAGPTPASTTHCFRGKTFVQ